jgi:hypothetical protein
MGTLLHGEMVEGIKYESEKESGGAEPFRQMGAEL